LTFRKNPPPMQQSHSIQQSCGVTPVATAQHGARLPCPYSKQLHQPPLTPPSSKYVKPYHKKQAETLFLNIETMVKRVGINNVGVLTLTFPNKTSREEAQRKWHSLWTHEFSKRYGQTIKVFERHRNGSVHYHLILELPKDIRSGFDWVSFDTANGIFKIQGRSPSFLKYGKAYSSSASPHLKAEWKYLQQTLKKYGFGRAELLPIRRDAIAVGRYMAKALTAPRSPEDKGTRMVSYLHGCKSHSSQWGWNTPWTWVWRKKLAEWAKREGCTNHDDVRAKHGANWAWYKQNEIMGVRLPSSTLYPSERHRKIADVGPVTDSLEAVRSLRKKHSQNN
jgi:hypothetical protein